jgi:hypothetical protein
LNPLTVFEVKERKWLNLAFRMLLIWLLLDI